MGVKNIGFLNGWLTFFVLFLFCNEPAKKIMAYGGLHLNLPSSPIRASMLLSGPPDKNFLRLCNKKFVTVIYKDIQAFDFQVLWECSSYAFSE